MEVGKTRNVWGGGGKEAPTPTKRGLVQYIAAAGPSESLALAELVYPLSPNTFLQAIPLAFPSRNISFIYLARWTLSSISVPVP